MTVFVPFWWSPRIYFIHMDDVRGGWRGVFFRIRAQREPIWGAWGFSFRLQCAFGIGSRERLLS